MNIDRGLEAIGSVGALIYIFSISVLSYYIAILLRNIAGYTSPIPISYITIFISLIPITIPLKTNTYFLMITFIAIYSSFAVLDTLRKVEGERPIVRMFLLASMIFIISVVLEYIQNAIGVHTGYPKTSNDYEYFLSALIAPLNEEIGFRLTIIGLAGLILYSFTTIEKDFKGYFKSFFHPGAVLSKNRDSIKILYSLVILTSIFFGFAHILGGGWEIGKVSLAIIAGLYLGYLFVKYGFTTSVLGHAYFNVYLLSQYFLYTLADEGKLGYFSIYAYYIGQSIYITFSIGLGIVVTLYYTYSITKKYNIFGVKQYEI